MSMLFSGQIKEKYNTSTQAQMAVNRVDWQLINNKLLSTHKAGNYESAKKVNVNFKPLSNLTTWTCHGGF